MLILHLLLQALQMAFLMFWEILWALILGFSLSAMVQAVVSKAEMTKLLPDDSPRSLVIACGLGAASSSCSYAAVALARSLFRKGANFTSAMAFMLASTNLVIELSLVLVVFLGWRFALAELLGAPLMVFFLAFFFRIFLKPNLLEEAQNQAEKGMRGLMEGHAEMDMSVTEGPLLRRIFSSKGLTAISHCFIMDWAAIWKDIAAGVLISGALAAWVPKTFWQNFFLVSHPFLSKLWGPLVGPLVAIFSFVCSVGNIPLAAVLWNGGISFGGVVAFIFGDLIILPILNIYRKYYGKKMSFYLLGILFLSMSLAALVVEFAFGAFGLVPVIRNALISQAVLAFNPTTILDLIFIFLAFLFTIRFVKTGGIPMLKMMDGNLKESPCECHSKETYSCPMHPEIKSQSPGSCPKCHMALVSR